LPSFGFSLLVLSMFSSWFSPSIATHLLSLWTLQLDLDAIT
jgi:hypothetical protein